MRELLMRERGLGLAATTPSPTFKGGGLTSLNCGHRSPSSVTTSFSEAVTEHRTPPVSGS